jgi:hypothetical protein
MLVRLPPVLFSLSSLSVSSVKLRILENFTLYLRNSWSLNLRAIENCICGLRSIERQNEVHFTDSADSTQFLELIPRPIAGLKFSTRTVNAGYGFGDCIPWYRGRGYRQQAPRGQAPPVINYNNQYI